MRVVFVLPAPIRIPMGGAKIVARYAEELARLGHEAIIVGPKRTDGPLRGTALRVAKRLRDRLHGVAPTPYYQPAGVETIEPATVSASSIPSADVIVATGVQTAPWVASLPASHGRKLYFVQGDETFVRPDARDSWRMGLDIVTCAHWLAREVREEGGRVLGVVPNAVDPREFDRDRPITGRPASVLALYHRHPVKGPDLLVDALARIGRAAPEARRVVFAARPPRTRLGTGVELHVRPPPSKLRRLYNEAAVLLHPSRSEGWPLVPMEAAMCGAAVVAAPNHGVREYLKDPASMAQVGSFDGAALGQAALELLADDARRTRLAEAARRSVERFSWSDSVGRLLAVLQAVR